MLRALRAQVQTALGSVNVHRKPALRRSDRPDALLATDLPLAADREAVQDFTERMTALGWRVGEEKNWLFLDAEVPVPEDVACSEAAGELGCCLSLLERHEGSDAPKETIRAIVKAAEAGNIERLCAQLHRDWAAALRRHEPLPGGLQPYLSRAAQDMQKEADA